MGAYSTPPDSLAGFEGGAGKRRGKEEGRRGKGKEGRKKGKGRGEGRGGKRGEEVKVGPQNGRPGSATEYRQQCSNSGVPCTTGYLVLTVFLLLLLL